MLRSSYLERGYVRPLDLRCEDGALTPKQIESDFLVLAGIDCYCYSEIDKCGLFIRNGVANEVGSFELTRFRMPNVSLDELGFLSLAVSSRSTCLTALISPNVKLKAMNTRLYIYLPINSPRTYSNVAIRSGNYQ